MILSLNENESILRPLADENWDEIVDSHGIELTPQSSAISSSYDLNYKSSRLLRCTEITSFFPIATATASHNARLRYWIRFRKAFKLSYNERGAIHTHS